MGSYRGHHNPPSPRGGTGGDSARGADGSGGSSSSCTAGKLQPPGNICPKIHGFGGGL